jgi:hypothetical protein
MKKMTSGIKHDLDKLPWDLLPYDALAEVVKVLQFGAKKYTARNWEKGIRYSRLYSAAKRHLDGDGNLSKGWWNGETYDKETGINHLAHSICELLFALSFEVRNNRIGLDDRPKEVEDNV